MYRTHHHRHSNDSGIATLIGLILTFILLRAWLFGDLFSIVNTIGFKTTGDFASPESMGSVSYVVVAFIANLIYGVGQFAILAWSGLGWVINDVIAGYRQWSAERMGRTAPPATFPSFDPIGGIPSATKNQPVNVVEPDPMERILGQFQENMLALQESLTDLSERVDELAAAKPAARTTTRSRAKA